MEDILYTENGEFPIEEFEIHEYNCTLSIVLNVKTFESEHIESEHIESVHIEEKKINSVFEMEIDELLSNIKY